ncbi:hypothetical protein MtrunA17_Chr4g0058251 [Medicago truncatula]|uniref:Transmembrane protein n=1 Tax=Medicago truncatula TaxID=3880 RepID=A0A396ICY6_MEDTR|nr:hypothetical protein MtrunA17_Chr4g0058251 [Medicago truncatula]
MAASRYFFIPRTILMATISFLSLSQHSNTCPKVPSPILLWILSREVKFSPTAKV